MAPATTIPHKSGGHQRYSAGKTNNATRHQADLDAGDSDAEAGALQPLKEARDDDFEGFGTEGEDEDGGAQGGDSDAESVDFKLDSKLQQKPVLPKDAEEEELERMIFGDSEGFRQGLENFSLDRTTGTYGGESDESGAEGADYDDVADQDLFMFDSGPMAAPAGSVAVKKSDETDDEDGKPAWEDSDDERLVVSLASVPQLRKLRETADDDMVDGREYSRRLRRQYERLYPTPGWAKHATGKANKKRRRTMDDDESGDESASDMDVDDEDLSTQPLARLLKDADILSRTSRGNAKRRKLQAGTIDIQRLKDVAKSGPVSHLSLTLERIITNHQCSLPSPRSRSTLPTHYYSLPAPVQRCTFTTSTRTRRTLILCSHHYTSSALLSLRLRSTHPLQTPVSSSAHDDATFTYGISRQVGWKRCRVSMAINTSNGQWSSFRYHQMANTWLFGVLPGRAAVSSIFWMRERCSGRHRYA